MEISDLPHTKQVKINPKSDALIVVDMQYDFLPSGALPVTNGDQLILGINQLITKFYINECNIVFTQDWHPSGHASFASTHGKKPFEEYQAAGIGPVLWPDHCVPNTKGAEIHKELHMDKAHLILRKGYRPNIDSYSAFLENDKRTKTGLSGYLESLDIERVFITGLALDYCVFNTANDARNLGFDVILVTDLTLPVGSPEELLSHALITMQGNDVIFTKLNSIE